MYSQNLTVWQVNYKVRIINKVYNAVICGYAGSTVHLYMLHVCVQVHLYERLQYTFFFVKISIEEVLVSKKSVKMLQTVY